MPSEPDPEPAPSDAPAATASPISRRSLLGLGAAAGAGAGAVVVGLAGRGGSTTTVDTNGVPVITVAPQRLTVPEQQQAAGNVGVVRTIEPEQFPGATDDEQLSNAFAALREAGGEIRLRPGKTYTWTRSPETVDWSVHGGVVLTAWGATVNYLGAGIAFTSMQSHAPAGIRTLTVFGGTWVAAQADAFFKIQDSDNHLFFRCRGEAPNGTFIALSNVKFFCERNHFVELEDHGCREVLRFSVDGSDSPSFARTVVRDLRLQGGVTGHAKINIVTSPGTTQPAVYDSTFDGIVGNIPDGVIVHRLAGGMSGTRLSGYQVESQAGSKTAAYFDVGPLSGKLPTLVDGPPVLRSLNLFTPGSPATSPFAPLVTSSGITASGAVVTAPILLELNSAGPVSLSAADGNVALVTLNAPCTGAVLDVFDNQNPGSTATIPQTTQSFTLGFIQGGAGGFGYQWPSNCRFAQGVAPSDTTASTLTSVTFLFSGGLWLETARSVGVPTV